MSTERETMTLAVALDFADNPRPHHTLAAPADTNGELYRALKVLASAYREHLAREKAEPVAYYSREYCRYYDAADIASTLLNQDLISKGELIPLYTHQTAPAEADERPLE